MNDAERQDSDSRSTSHGVGGISMAITASQDPSCLSRIKYIYQFSAPIEETIVHGFSGCGIQHFRFSIIMPNAKDLIRIKKADQFQVDFVIGGDRAFVYFTGYHEHPPLAYLDDFDTRLHGAGLGRVRYVTGARPCRDQCPVKHLKNCSMNDDRLVS